MNSWDPPKTDFENPGSRAVRNNGPGRNFVRGLGGGKVKVYIKHVPISMSKDDLYKILTPHVKHLTLSLAHPNERSQRMGMNIAFAEVDSISEMEHLIQEVHNKPPLNLHLSKAHSENERKPCKDASNLTDYNQVHCHQSSVPTPSLAAALLPTPIMNPESQQSLLSTPPRRILELDSTPVMSRAFSSSDSTPSRTNGSDYEFERRDREEFVPPIPVRMCNNCKKPGSKLRCSVCFVRYCSIECRDDDWFITHQDKCRSPPPVICDETPTKHKPANTVVHEPSLPFAENSSKVQNLNKKTQENCNGVKHNSTMSNNNDSNLRKPFQKKKFSPKAKMTEELPQKTGQTQNKMDNEGLNTSPIDAPVADVKAVSDYLIEGINSGMITEVDHSSLKMTIDCEKTRNLLKKLDSLNVSEKGEDLLPLAEVTEGSILSAYSSKFQSWNRAVVIAKEQTNAKVCYIDYGNIENVSKTKKLDPQFTPHEYPAASCCVSLLKKGSVNFTEMLKIDQGIKFKVKEKKGKDFIILLKSNDHVYDCLLKPMSVGCFKQKESFVSDLTPTSKPELSAHVEQDLPKAQEVVAAPLHEMVQNIESPVTNTSGELTKNIDPLQNLQKSIASVRNSAAFSRAIPKVVMEASASKLRKPLPKRESFNLEKLNLTNLPAGETHQVFPVHMKENGDLCVQIIAHLEKELEDLSQCMERAKDGAVPEHLSDGELVCAFVEADQIWYRAKVIDTEKDCVNVLFIDYGNTENVPYRDTRVFYQALCQFPVLCVEVKLDILPEKLLAASGFANEMINSMSPVQLLVKQSSPLITVLSDTEGKPLFEEFQRVAATPNGVTSLTSANGVKMPVTVTYSESNCVTLPVQKEVEVYVLHVDSPLRIFVTLGNKLESIKKDLTAMSDVMNAYCSSIKSPYHVPRVDELCLAKFSADKLWYRVVCVDLNEREKTAEVLFVDYGNSERLPFSSMCKMMDEFMKLELFAVHCILKGATEHNLKPGVDDAIKALVRVDERITVDVVEKTPGMVCLLDMPEVFETLAEAGFIEV